ncbi:MAG: BON domain-containing protein [Myxococcota bacterium]
MNDGRMEADMNDTQLQRDVLNEIEWEPSVHAAEIGVAVKGGVVTLNGTVGSYAEKLAAEIAAKRVRGVLAVTGEIEVKLPSSLKRTDAEIARAVLDALGWNVELPHDKVKVKVEDGWVTLEGELDWAFQRDAAMRSVRYLTGVRGMTSLVTIKPRVETSTIKRRIADAFRRNAELDAGRIWVDAIGGRVALYGRVHSWQEHEQATQVAWSAPGVVVQNNLTVEP